MPLLSHKCSNFWSRVPQRFLVCALCYLVVLVCYYQRVTFYQARDEFIFTVKTKNYTLYSDCPFMTVDKNSIFDVKDDSAFLWDEGQFKTIFRSFFIGYLLAMIPAGVMADVHGSKGVVGWGIAISSTVALLHEKFINFGYTFIVLCRFVQGFGQGMMWCGVTVMISRWAPVSERTIFVGFSQSGYLTGRVLSYVVPLFIAPLRNSWEAHLYLGGFFGVVVCIAWYFTVSSDPTLNRRIKVEERILIINETEAIERGRPLNPMVPWRGMFRSAQFLSLVLFQSGCSWIYGEMHHTVVIYLTEYIHLPRRFALYCHVLACSAGIFPPIIFGAFSDWLINNHVMSRTANRKVFGFFGNLLMVPSLFIILSAHCNGTVVMALYTCIYFFAAVSFGSWHANCIDLCPQHAGAIYSVVHSISIFSTFISTDVFEMLKNRDDPDKFWVLYLINAVVFLISTLPYLVFGSADVQPWNYSVTQSSAVRPQLNTTARPQLNTTAKP